VDHGQGRDRQPPRLGQHRQVLGRLLLRRKVVLRVRLFVSLFYISNNSNNSIIQIIRIQIIRLFFSVRGWNAVMRRRLSRVRRRHLNNVSAYFLFSPPCSTILNRSRVQNVGADRS
jgi:hypothetical protein